MNVAELKKFAAQIRIDNLKCLKNRGFGHVGGCMSVVEVLAVLYGDIMKYDPKNPAWDGRDYLVMSKGHAGPALFATLELKGFFPSEWMDTMCDPKTCLPSHCDRLKTPGIDVSTGSLGQGLSVAAGIAQGLLIKEKSTRVYAILGDGECAEGQIWEAAGYAAHYNIGNLIAFVDWNKKQVDGELTEIMGQLDIGKKFESFGWYALSAPGADVGKIQSAILDAQKNQGNRPAVIILDGIKGSGVPQYEQMEYNHFFDLDQAEADSVIKSLEQQLASME